MSPSCRGSQKNRLFMKKNLQDSPGTGGQREKIDGEPGKNLWFCVSGFWMNWQNRQKTERRGMRKRRKGRWRREIKRLEAAQGASSLLWGAQSCELRMRSEAQRTGSALLNPGPGPRGQPPAAAPRGGPSMELAPCSESFIKSLLLSPNFPWKLANTISGF